MRVFRALLFLTVCEAATVASLHAQKSGILGTVSDTLGNPLNSVQIELSGTDYASISNLYGEFKLNKVKPGPYTLFMRRIGFEAISMPIEIKNGDPMELDFELTPTTVRLATVAVKASGVSEKLRRVGFADRLKTSGVPASHFITRAELERTNPMSLIHVLERKGGRMRQCMDATVWIDGTPPAINSDGTPTIGTPAIPFKNATPRTLIREQSNSSNVRFRALDNIPVRAVDGMEVFASISEVPVEFRAGGTSNVHNKCVVLVWTREGNR